MHDGTITPSHSGMISTLSTKQSLAARQISQTALITAVHQLFVKPGSHTPLSHSTEALLLALLTDCLPSSSPSTSVAVTPTPGSQTTGQGIPSSLAAGANDTGNVADLERHIPLVLTALSELLSRSRTHFVQLPLFVDGMTSMLDASPSAFHNMQQQQQRSHAESPTEPTPDMLLQSQRATTADSLLLFSDIITAQAAVLLETGRLSTAISALLTGTVTHTLVHKGTQSHVWFHSLDELIGKSLHAIMSLLVHIPRRKLAFCLCIITSFRGSDMHSDLILELNSTNQPSPVETGL